MSYRYKPPKHAHLTSEVLRETSTSRFLQETTWEVLEPRGVYQNIWRHKKEKIETKNPKERRAPAETTTNPAGSFLARESLPIQIHFSLAQYKFFCSFSFWFAFFSPEKKVTFFYLASCNMPKKRPYCPWSQPCSLFVARWRKRRTKRPLRS